MFISCRACRLLVVALAAVLMSSGAPLGFAVDEGKPTVEKIEYKGWKNNLRLSNGTAELIVTLDVGPRVISYRLRDGKNVFKQYAEQLGKTGEPDWQIRGGHRLWVGPEDLTRTYAPDNGPVQYKELGSGSPGVRLTPRPTRSTASRRKWIWSWRQMEAVSPSFIASRTSATRRRSWRRGHSP